MARHRDDDDEQEYTVIEKHGSGLAPFFWGLAVGAGLALLFAPMSGSELRAEIRNRGLRLKEMAEDKAEEIEELVSDKYQRGRERVEDTIDGVKRKAKEGRQFAHDVADAGKSAALTAREELERRLAEAREARRSGRPSGDEEPVA